MAIGESLARMRRERNLTQEDVARRLYVTRQAVSRWETGETEPGVDMCKLIAATFDMPLMELLEMPDKDYCQSCGMPFYQEADHGSEAGGGRSRDFCSMCYENGAFVRDETMEELIEEAALAIRLEATLDELTDTIHCHPTVAEALREAALAAQKRAIHIPNKK